MEGKSVRNLSVEYLNSLFQSLPCSIMFYSYENTPKFIYCNAEAMKIHGLEPEDDPEIAFSNYLSYTFPEDIEEIRAIFASITSIGQRVPIERRLLLPDGGVRWVTGFVECSLYHDGNPTYKVVYSDVTEKVQEVQRNRDDYQRLLDICRVTVEKEYENVILYNTKTEESRIYYLQGKGFPSEEHSCVTKYTYILELIDCVYPDDRDRFYVLLNTEMLLAELEKGHGVLCFRYRVQRKSNEIRWQEFKVQYIDDTKKLLLVLTKDIHDELEAELSRREKLEKALNAANAASSAKQDFLSHMSHEMRTPLTGICGMLELMKKNRDEHFEEYLNNAVVSAQHLTCLINDVLDMSKIESGTLKLDKSYVTMEEFVEYLHMIVDARAKAKKLTVTYDLCKPVYKYAYIDVKRTHQILLNLLINSIKYTPEGGHILFGIKAAKIANGQLAIQYTVKDDGIGMSEEFVSKAFLPFEQEGYSSSVNGCGLGLAITHQLCNLMGGRIKLKSEQGKGTTITVSFETLGRNSLTEGEELLKEKVAQTIGEGVLVSGTENLCQNETKPADYTGKRALIVEDNDINMMIAESMLQEFGLITETAVDGDKAVTAFKKSIEGYYDVIFMDIMMPVMNGLEATKAIRSCNRHDAKTVPIVAMTANAFAEDVTKSIQSGMNAHIAKPFSQSDFERILTLCNI